MLDSKKFILVKNLIKIPSTKGNNKALNQVLNVAKEELKSFKIEKFNKNNKPSLIAYNCKTRPKKFKIILNAHLDVVSANKNQFKPKIKGDKLWGRGAYDMKAAAAIQISVFKDLAKKLKYPIGLQLVTDEEIGGFNGTKYQINKGITADFVIAGEPTNLDINNKAKGIIWAEIDIKGKEAHGAYPWQGKNAVVKATQIINELFKKYPIPKKEVWKTTINIAKIKTTNTTFNKVPNNAQLLLDIRFIPQDYIKINNNLKRISKKYKCKVNLVLKEPHQYTPKNNKYIKSLKKSINKVIKKRPSIIAKHGGSDIRHFNAKGIKGITFGPIGGGIHANNEWVSIDSLKSYYYILRSFLINLE